MALTRTEYLELSKKLINLRRDLNITQDEFAGKLGVSRQAVSKWESGISLPSLKAIKKISEEFGIPVNELIFESNDPPSERSTLKNRSLLSKILLIAGLIVSVTIPFLAEIKRAVEMDLFKEAYTHSYDYIWEYPIIILVYLSLSLLALGIYFFFKKTNLPF